MILFKQVQIGTKFHWQSNFGANDAMQKTGENKVKNLKTGNEYELSFEKTYFTIDCPVLVSESFYGGSHVPGSLDDCLGDD